jgi:hypothetical protein
MKVSNKSLTGINFDDIDWQEVDLPIITSIRKDEKSQKIGMSVMKNLIGIAEMIMTNSGRFRTITEVHRAAHYLGIRILGKLYSQKNKKDPTVLYGSSFYDYLVRNEKLFKQGDIVDNVMIELNRMMNNLRENTITVKRVKRSIKQLIDSIPEDIKEDVKERIKNELNINKYRVSYEVIPELLKIIEVNHE